MATTKKAVKKAATKRVAKKAAPDDGVYYVVSERSKLLAYTPVTLYKNRDDAEAMRRALEANSILSYKAAKVDRVYLAKVVPTPA